MSLNEDIRALAGQQKKVCPRQAFFFKGFFIMAGKPAL